MSRTQTLAYLLGVLALVAAGCGSGEDSSGEDSGSTETTTAAIATTESPPAVEDTQAGDGEDRSAELVGRWEVTHYTLPGGGGLTNIVGDAPVYIEFAADGTISYHTGCNAGGSAYTTRGTYAVPKSALDDVAEGQAITIGPVFEQTEQGCDGFLGDQDRDLPADMGAATRFILDGERLLLLDEFLLIDTTRSG